MSYPNAQLFIDDNWTDADDGRTIEVLNPADGRVIGTRRPRVDGGSG